MRIQEAVLRFLWWFGNVSYMYA